MPISKAAITSRYTPARGIERTGRIYKGAARTGEDLAKNRPGRDLGEFFRVELEAKHDWQREALRETWESLYGKQVAELPFAFVLSATADEAFPFGNEQWGKSGMLRQCDGEKQSLWLNSQLGKLDRTPIPCAYPECQCQQIGRLNIVLPQFIRECGGTPGFFTLATHSKIDIEHIYNRLRAAQEMNGTLIGVPFRISRRKEVINIPEMKDNKPTGKRIPTPKWVIDLSMESTFVPAQIAAAAVPMLTAPSSTPALPEVVDGEIMDEPKEHPWSPVEQDKFSRHWSSQGVTAGDQARALGVTSLRDWKRSAETANRRMSQWIEQQLR